MNLIEKLGGYEKAKEIVFDPLHPQMTHVSNDGRHWVNEEFSHIPEIQEQIPTMVRIKDIRKALLEYRRQHNIFEVGDKVIIESYRNTYITCGRPSQYSIGDLMLIHIMDGNVIEDDDYNFIDYRDVRHATDAEIKAGKRLEVNQ